MNLLYSSVMSRRRSVLNSLRLFAVLPAFHWSNMTAHASSWIRRLCHPLKEDSSNTFHADLPPRKKNTKSRCNTNLHAFNRSCESPIHLKARMHIHPGILKSPWGSQSLGYPTVPPILGNCYALGLRHWALRLGLLIALLQLLPAPRSRCGTGTISGPLSHLSTESTGIYFKHMYGVCFFCPP